MVQEMKKLIVWALVAVILSCGSGTLAVWLGADYKTAFVAAFAAAAVFAAVVAKEEGISFWKLVVVYSLEGAVIFCFFRWVLPLVAAGGGQ